MYGAERHFSTRWAVCETTRLGSDRLKAFMAAHNIEPAYTPTYSSWLNAIEAHFTSLKKFAIGGTDDPSHEYRRWRIARYLTWRNKEKGSSKAALAQFSRVRLYRH